MYESSGVPVDVSVAKLVDFGTMLDLQTAAETGTFVSGLGDSAYFSGTKLQIFQGSYWLVLDSPWAWEAGDFWPLPESALANLPQE